MAKPGYDFQAPWVLQCDCPDKTVKSLDATCGELNIKVKRYIYEVNILGVNCATDRVFSKRMSLVKMRAMSTVRCKV